MTCSWRRYAAKERIFVILGLDCGSADNVPAGLDLLLDRSRLNDAIGRGKSVCYFSLPDGEVAAAAPVNLATTLTWWVYEFARGMEIFSTTLSIQN